MSRTEEIRHLRVSGAIALTLVLAGCQHRVWPQWSCFEMDLDGVAWGATIQETWELARARDWRCSIEKSVRADGIGLRCTEDGPGEASIFEFWFVHDALVAAALERSAAGPRGNCRPDPGFDAWARAELARLRARYGPSETTHPVEPRGRAEAHRWQTRDDEIVLRIYLDAQRLSIEGEDRAALRSLERDRPERSILLQSTEDGISEAAVVEEVMLNLPALGTAEQSYYSEFGRYVAAGPYPPVVSEGEYFIWRAGETGGFEQIGWSTSRTSCSYAVSVGDQCQQLGGVCGHVVGLCRPR